MSKILFRSSSNPSTPTLLQNADTSIKGAPLTSEEIDFNFNSLYTNKAEISGQVFTGAVSASNLSGTNTGDQDLSGLALKTGANAAGTWPIKNAVTLTDAAADPTLPSTTISTDADLLQQMRNVLKALSPNPITGSTTFTKSSNTIALSGIVAALGLEIGDVIYVTGTANNNKVFTVEYIDDANTIRVNYAHANGAGLLSLVDETAPGCTISRIAKYYSAAAYLGMRWVPVNRTSGVNYTNLTNRAIAANFNINTTGTSQFLRAYINVDDHVFSQENDSINTANDHNGGLIVQVPPGSVYSYSWNPSLITSSSLMELR